MDTPIKIMVESAGDLVDPEAALIRLDSSSIHAEGPVYVPTDGSCME